MRDRILVMYITGRSGHFQAARAVSEGIRRLHPRCEVLSIDAFQYLNPILARMVDRMYLSVIQKLPELWDYLYDNPVIVKRSERIRKLLHRYDSPRLISLLTEFQPQAIACTQAFPCGLAAHVKREDGLTTPLYGILTDFSPHAFWVHAEVDGYVVGAPQTRQWLIERRIGAERIHTLGIPIDPAFAQKPNAEGVRRRLQLASDDPILLLMGGGQGLGPIVEAVKALDRIRRPVQLLVVAGTNESLYHRLITLAPRLKHPIRVFGHVEFISDLMSVAQLIVTKPGGLTTSEALAKGLPMVILDPIPGQEVKNARFLTAAGVACEAPSPEALPLSVEGLLNEPSRLKAMAGRAAQMGKPSAALDAARLILSSS
ncbi:MAG: glycosyltransferase [Candidatus Omnitrophica bacterium]|nr:glycosyltransferase [Candidatus Omnitrophota bacterium]